mmetsp:Transcript_36426/g.102893  ORF Transcript_36426/g.102893 Transcript_36426/m.102893 type:complete len:432 (+) Transcript_36426:226-1521(+)|eukprot:CAMPEP_0117680664 /NCGR_PEP_ID=MMETSP0804-20121206/18491_1 /TAXON_ID=1074897 /ORGANISM="Tetraselmis astigmatica, Strain CCMP880" /LENGTH=431 /DNA_ID=CAMNT_0005490213 /DNA_START=177 /DNA_END=1472 /DNA_ORIENTATION=+
MGTSSHQAEVGKGGNQAAAAVLSQRKRISGSKKHTGKSLGAVRLKDSQAPLEEREQQENVDPQPSRPPALSPAAAPAPSCRRKSSTALFQDELARTCTADKWFDEQLNGKAASRNSSRSTGGSSVAQLDTSPRSNSRLVRQLKSFQDALKRHFESALSAEELADCSGTLEGIEFAPTLQTTPQKADQSNSLSLMDLGLDAINKVGRTINEFADKLDTTVEHWLDSLQSVDELQRFLDLRGDQSRVGSGQAAGRTAAHAIEETGPPSVSRSAGRNGHRTAGSLQTSGTRKCQQRELTVDELAQKEAEFRRVQEELQRLKAELSYAASKCSSLSEENILLRSQGCLSPESPQAPLSPSSISEPDPITDLMAKQLETLLNEKARLVQDNARLQRENTTLHDILSISFGSDEDEPDGAEDDDASSSRMYAHAIAV